MKSHAKLIRPEGRSAATRKANETLGAERRSEVARKRNAALGPEKREENARKAREGYQRRGLERFGGINAFSEAFEDTIMANQDNGGLNTSSQEWEDSLSSDG